MKSRDPFRAFRASPNDSGARYGAHVPVDRESPVPVYFQIAQDLRRRIARGEWEVGDRLVPEVALAAEYGISRITMRKALGELVNEGVVERRRGIGTYVRNRPRPPLHDLNAPLQAYAERLRDMGRDNSADVLERALMADPPEDVRRALGLSVGEPAVYLSRRVRFDGEPVALYEAWLDAARVPGLEGSPQLGGSLSQVLADEYGLTPTRVDGVIEVVRSTPDEADLLDTEPEAPLLLVTATSFVDADPLEHSQLRWVGDRMRFHITSSPSPEAVAAADDPFRRG